MFPPIVSVTVQGDGLSNPPHLFSLFVFPVGEWASGLAHLFERLRANVPLLQWNVLWDAFCGLLMVSGGGAQGCGTEFRLGYLVYPTNSYSA